MRRVGARGMLGLVDCWGRLRGRGRACWSFGGGMRGRGLGRMGLSIWDGGEVWRGGGVWGNGGVEIFFFDEGRGQVVGGW